MFRLPIVKFFSRILNRITITVVLVALQVAWLLWAFFSLTTGRVWVNAGLQLLSLLMMLYLVRKDENSAYKIGWIALMGVLPLLGGALYLSFGNKRPAKQLRSKLQAVDDAHKADLAQQPGQTDGLDASGLGMSRYLARYGRYPAWRTPPRSILPAAKPCTPSCCGTWSGPNTPSLWNISSCTPAKCGTAWKPSSDARPRRGWTCA